MKRRRIKSYFIKDNQIKQKVLCWSKKFDRVCYLNSNEYYKDNSIQASYRSFDSILAAGTANEIEGSSLKKLKDFYERTENDLFGFFTYDLKNEIENLHSENIDFMEMPIFHFFCPLYIIEIKPEELIISQHDKSDINTDVVVEEILSQDINFLKYNRSSNRKNFSIKNRLSKNEYVKNVNKIKEHIQQGDVYELNYCQEFYSEKIDLEPFSLYNNLNTISPTPFSAYYRLHDKYLISASPERFLRKQVNKLISQPIKGTIRRGNNSEEDNFLREELRNNTKERSENIMIVDLVRNDLSKVAIPGSVNVEELCEIYTFNQLHQMISTISCNVGSAIHPIDIIKEVFPMGSMTGAPKIRAMELIEKYEVTKRGLFSGAVGYLTSEGDFDFNVVIRSILYNKNNQYLSFMAGSAITINSIAESEYDESLLKAKAMINALQTSI